MTRPRCEVRLETAVDDETRRLSYAVVEGRLLLGHHCASFQVFAEGESRRRHVWITEDVPPR